MRLPAVMLLLCVNAAGLFAQDAYTVVFDTYYSQQLNRSVPFYVLLPPGYDSTSEHYPVLYMLRGAAAEWITPQDGTRQGRDLRTIADTLLARRSMGKILFVLPELSQPGTDQEIHVLATEMFARVDSFYRTIPTRWHRGVDGFSYGGLDAMNLATDSPLRLCTTGSYDGSFWAFDMARIAAADTAVIRDLSGIRFMHHSGEGGNTNQTSVEDLVAVMSSRGLHNEFSPLRLSPGATHIWWYADEHAMITLPLHWETFSRAPQRIQVNILSPGPGAHVAGIVPVNWSALNAPAGAQVLLECSRNKGKTWHALFSGPATTTGYSWNTATETDGAWYTLRVTVTADTLYGTATLASTFTVDNPGNGPPGVNILSPLAGASVSGAVPVQWEASDPENDTLTFSIEVSGDRGVTWEPMVAGLHGTGQYTWDSREAPNCTAGSLRVRCSDGALTGAALVPDLHISNVRTSLGASAFVYRSGHGDGTVIPRVVSPADVKPHLYEVTFPDTGKRAGHVTVRDCTRDSLVLVAAPLMGAGNEGPAFDGIRLEITQPDAPVFSADSSRWLTGSSTFAPRVTLPSLASGGGTVTGTAYPADYLITISDMVLDTSVAALDVPAMPMKFSFWNLTEQRKGRVLFGDQDADARISQFDEIVILEPGGGAAPLVTWDLFFPAMTNPVPPVAGDVYYFKVLKPFRSTDTLRFAATLSGVERLPHAEIPDRLELFQNYPNPFNPSTRIEFGVTRMQRVTVTVYSLLGQVVATLLDATLPAGRYGLTWTAAAYATGVYFVRVQAGPRAETRKMLLLR